MFEGPQRANKRLDLMMRVKADALSMSEMRIRIHQENFGSKSGRLPSASINSRKSGTKCESSSNEFVSN